MAHADVDAAAAVVVRRREHVDARLRLLAINDELMEQVRLLGGLLRPRYRHEPALAELWENVRQVDGPARFGRVVRAIGPAAPSEGGASPAPGNEMVVPQSPPAATPQELVNPDASGERNVS